MSPLTHASPTLTTNKSADTPLLRRLLRNRSGGIGLLLVIVYCVIALLGGLGVTPYPVNEQHVRDRLKPPSAQYMMGTDLFGRDIASRLMGGAANSLRVALLSVALSAALGTLLGTVSGYVGGLFDNVLMRIMDVFFALPALLLALVIVSVFGSGVTTTVLAIATVYTPIFARVVRGPVLSVKELDFITAARCLGMKDARILLRHILPNTLAPLIVQVQPGAVVVAADRSGLELLRGWARSRPTRRGALCSAKAGASRRWPPG
ncbi:MAG: ABC transporter permease [Anaerolineae bacterium]